MHTHKIYDCDDMIIGKTYINFDCQNIECRGV